MMMGTNYKNYNDMTFLFSGDLILAEKPVMTMPVAIFDSGRESTEDWLDKVRIWGNIVHNLKQFNQRLL